MKRALNLLFSTCDRRSTHSSPFLLRVLCGLLGGIVATGPMTMLMISLHRRLPLFQRHPLPPREITMKIAQAAGLASKIPSSGRAGLTLMNHFAYGGLAGAAYMIGRTSPQGSPFTRGPLFGALVWAVSYLGLLPLLGILKPATKHPAERNFLMFAAHLVWGLILGLFSHTMMREFRRPTGALLPPSVLLHFDVR